MGRRQTITRGKRERMLIHLSVIGHCKFQVHVTSQNLGSELTPLVGAPVDSCNL